MDLLKNFGERLTELMDEKDIKSDMLAGKIGVSGTTVRQWKRGISDININHLIKLADYFDCSIEYLVGRSDNYLPYKIQELPLFPIRLRQILEERNKSRYSLDKETKFKDNYFYKWDKGHTSKLTTLADLAKILDCTIDYLIGREN